MEFLRIKYVITAARFVAGANNLKLGCLQVKSSDPFPIFELRISNAMARPKWFRNPTRVSLTLDRRTLINARRVARRAKRSLSEVVSEILNGYFRKNGRRERPA